MLFRITLALNAYSVALTYTSATLGAAATNCIPVATFVFAVALRYLDLLDFTANSIKGILELLLFCAESASKWTKHFRWCLTISMISDSKITSTIVDDDLDFPIDKILVESKVTCNAFLSTRMEKLRIKTIPGIMKIAGLVVCLAGVTTLTFYQGPHLKPFYHLHFLEPRNTQNLQPDACFGKKWMIGCLLFFVSITAWGSWLVLQVAFVFFLVFPHQF